MGAQEKSSPVNSSSLVLQRVKVYRLNDDGKWDDRGTGHVTVDYLERTEDLGLIVIDEEDNETLLMHRILPDEIYRRQEDTIISWRDPDLSTDLALSFQEATGCSYIWESISNVQRGFHFGSLGNLDIGPRPAIGSDPISASRANDEGLRGGVTELRQLPSVEPSALPLILKMVVESGIADQIRVAELILQEQDFFPNLMDLFRMNEDIDDMDELHLISKIVRGIILLNSPRIFDKIFGDEYIMDIIGALEYDPEAPKMQKHRLFLKHHVIFKEAIPIKDPVVVSKIHQSYRIGYIKDVILPRVLDEGTISSLNSMIHANNATVVSLLKDDSSFIQELFSKMKSSETSLETKKNLILFLQEFCSLSKSLQLVQQLHLFRDLASEGVFDIITEALQSNNKKLICAGTDILILFLNQDPNILRTYVIQQKDHSLLGLLVKGMTAEFGEDIHCQFLEIIRILLDSYTSSGTQRDAIVDIFYERHLELLVDVIMSSCPSKIISQINDKAGGLDKKSECRKSAKPEILLNICELLCFCVVHHPYRIKCNFLLNNIIEKVLYLTRRKERYLVVAAVRFLRTIISRKDEHLLRHIVKNNLLKPVVEAFLDNGSRYNMLHSGVLELLEYVRKENIKPLIQYVVESFWDQLCKYESIGLFQALKVKYEQSLEKYDAKASVSISVPRKRVDDRGLEKEEEDYFNEDSDEEDTASAGLSNTRNRNPQTSVPNGTHPSTARSSSGGLVDYADDDDDDYNPPPRGSNTSVEDEKTLESSILKRKFGVMTDAEKQVRDVTKKYKLDGHTSRNASTIASASSCSTSSLSDSEVRSHSSSEVECAEEESEKSVNIHYRTTSSDANDRHSSGGEGPPLVPVNDSPDSTANGPSVTGSEPYSVR